MDHRKTGEKARMYLTSIGCMSLTVGGKTSGVLHVAGNRIVSYVVKGINEYEGQTATVRLRLGKQTIRIVGDGSGYDL